MDYQLTLKQERFVDAYILTGTCVAGILRVVLVKSHQQMLLRKEIYHHILMHASELSWMRKRNYCNVQTNRAGRSAAAPAVAVASSDIWKRLISALASSGVSQSSRRRKYR